MRAYWREVLFWLGHPRGVPDPCPGCQLRALRIRALRAELSQAERTRDFLVALVVEQELRRTTGGVPHPYTHTWERGTLPPPPSASDPNAPELGRAAVTPTTEGPSL